MAVLELVSARPDWLGALTVALTRPAGVPERRASEDPWASVGRAERPRRISDDLAWLRQASDEPSDHGLKSVGAPAAVVAWATAPEAEARLGRLRDRHVLDSAGFLLHEEERIAA